MTERNSDKSPDGAVTQRKPTTAAAIAGTPNPQGKGQVGFLQDWEESRPRNALTKPAPRLLADYFTSLLVLSANFKFKPSVETNYYLYRENDAWLLSPVSPDEWNTEKKRRAYAGRCMLHEDATWSIEPSANLGRERAISSALADFFGQFADRLRTAKPLEDELPIYAAKLPYYQRLFAAALSRSLKESMTRGTQTGQASTLWLAQIPRDAQQLLGAPAASV